MFTVAVKIEGMERRRRSTGLIHVIVGFFLLIKSLDFYKYLGESSVTPIALFAAVSIVSLVYGLFRKRLDPLAKHNAGIRLLQTVAFFGFGILMYRLGKTVDYASLFIWSFLTLLLFF